MHTPKLLKLLPLLRRAAGLAVLAGVTAALGACGFLAAEYQNASGAAVPATYHGLPGKSLAIVVDIDPAIMLEYPGARAEIGAYVTSQLQQNMPTVRLVRYSDVIHYQDDTMQWRGLAVKEVGKHFAVDRVLDIELIDYRTREPGGDNLLRGRLHAMSRVYEMEMPGSNAAWQKELDIYWPLTGAQDPLSSNDDAVRKRVLETFSEKLVNNFYDHKEMHEQLHDDRP